MSRYASGMRAWIFQRLTAIYLMLFLPWLILHFAFSAPQDALALKGWLAQPMISLAVLLGLSSLLLHAWIGVRDILIDYVKPFGLRLTLLTLTAFGLIACGVWGLQLVLLTRI